MVEAAAGAAAGADAAPFNAGAVVCGVRRPDLLSLFPDFIVLLARPYATLVIENSGEILADTVTARSPPLDCSATNST
jgi:hypothetical protein